MTVLTRAGRLRRSWDAAVAEPDPARALGLMREMLDRIGTRPGAYADQWPPFLRSMLQPRFLRLLTEADLDTLESVSGQIVGAPVGGARAYDLAEAWGLLVSARDARGEPVAALEQLVRLFHSDLADARARALAATELARRGARDDDHLAVYTDLLAREPAPPEITRLVATVLRIDLDSGDVRTARAGFLAQLLARHGVRFPGIDVALGIRDLADGATASAIEHLTRAYRLAPDDETAYAALLTARLRHGEPDTIAAYTDDGAHPESQRVHELIELSATLRWLDDPDITGPAPSDATRLSASGIADIAGEWRAFAIGRMALVAGDLRTAADTLVPLADTHDDRPQWAYHAAWAQLLRDDGPGVTRRFERVRDQPGAWAIGCLVLDADPRHDADGSVSRTVAAAPGGFAAFAAARVRLAKGEPPPSLRRRPPAKGTLPERLEALRTALGLRAHGQPSAMAELVRLQLFRRLPAPERLMWAGLAAMPTDAGQGHALLREAAGQYTRAATVLAAYEVSAGRPGSAAGLLDDAGPGGPKRELLRAWVLARRGDEERALAALEPYGTVPVPPAARRLRGLLRLRSAYARQSDGNTDDATAQAVLAAADLAAEDTDRTGGTGADDGPVLRGTLARAAAIFATGTVDEASAIRALPDTQDSPWQAWIRGFAQLVDAPDTVEPDACEALVHLLGETPPPGAVTALAGALTRACLRSGDTANAPVRIAALTEHLDALAARPLPPARAARILKWCDLARAAAVRHGPGDEPGAVRDGVAGAIARAERAVACGDRGAAVRLLRGAEADDVAGRVMRDVLVGALDGGEPPEVPANLAANVRRLLRMARAMAVARTDPEHGLTILAEALPEFEAATLATVLDMGRVLPVLTAAARPRGRSRGRPGPLVRVLRRLAKAPGAQVDALALARCATALGDFAIAADLWRRVLDTDPDTAGELRAEYAHVLCHRARQTRGDAPHEAVHLLREAAALLNPDEPGPPAPPDPPARPKPPKPSARPAPRAPAKPPARTKPPVRAVPAAPEPAVREDRPDDSAADAALTPVPDDVPGLTVAFEATLTGMPEGQRAQLRATWRRTQHKYRKAELRGDALTAAERLAEMKSLVATGSVHAAWRYQ